MWVGFKRPDLRLWKATAMPQKQHLVRFVFCLARILRSRTQLPCVGLTTPQPSWLRFYEI